MDEFSFPAIAVDQDPLCSLPFPHFAASPLWFPPSSDAERKISGDGPRGFFSAEEEEEEASKVAGAAALEDSMDMLWEDFNEELRRSFSERGREAKVPDDGTVELRCLQALSESKSGSLIHRRRSSLILILNVLKKLFLIHRDGSSRRTPLC
ncbi:hypothetical protein OPV22_022833 [Ensete ventricosum]|uniref:Uncharacterized protein n=1 Tax=Ensete ventricosum TaxID=4639 RepID=A0AAV8PC58_ENSVE|nr:hypothetical protein OPV22_022833 [Ensete ventricosum]